MTVIKAAITQTTWTGDKESMLDKHEQFARDAAAAGRAGHLLPGALLRPLLRHHPGPEVLRATPSRPTARSCSASPRSPRNSSMVMILPIYEEEHARRLLQHRGRRRRRRHDPRQVPQAPPPAPRQVLGEVLLPPRQPRLPRLRDRGRQDRRLHLLRPALPRGLARTRPQRRRRSSSTPTPPSPASPTGCGRSSRPAAAGANGYFVLQPNRVGREDNEYGDAGRRLLRHQPVRRSAGQLRRRAAAAARTRRS